MVINPLTKPSPAATLVIPAPAATAVPSGSYLQVGLMNPAIDRSMQDRLEQSGFSVKLVPLENSTASRVLVGPIQSATHQRELESKLGAGGYQFFLRRL